MTEIEPYQALARQDIYKAFELQLRKDFEASACALPENYVLVQGYENLVLQLADRVRQLDKSNNLHRLLYRIDVSEVQIKKQSQLQSEISFECIVAELIIKRILQKVILKMHFSSKP